MTLTLFLLALYLSAVVFALIMAAMAAWSDISGMVIDNALSILIAASAVAAYAALTAAGKADLIFGPLWAHLAAAGVVLATTAGMFALGWMGAGDSKMATACALWIGSLASFFTFFFFTTLAGGVLALIAIGIGRFKPLRSPDKRSWMGRAQAGESTVPYGVAIAVGLAALILQGGFLNLLDIGLVSPERMGG